MKTRQTEPLMIVALGGNALIGHGQSGTAEEQFANLRRPMAQISRLCAAMRVIITHGNGPQVGNLLLQQECCPELPKMPLEILVAQTQGQIGYMIESTLESALSEQGLKRHLLSLVSYVVVDRDDPAFANPTKPIGPVYSSEQIASLPWPVVSTPRGYRRVVASPRPLTVVEREEIRLLVSQGFIVVCCGGGGIPVIRDGRSFHGVDAVIDKDLVTACLALEVKADLLVIATDVSGAAVDFGTERQQFLQVLSVTQAEQYLDAGQFPPGSMGPKVDAAVQFMKGGGERAVICHLDEIFDAVSGRAGTQFIRQ